MKVLFLDIDGVLNKDGTKEKVIGTDGTEFTGVDKVLVKRFLDWHATRPDVEIVLSSSWRIPHAFVDCKAHLNENGIYWIDETPHLGGIDRGLEIQSWLVDNPQVTQYAILDDIQVKFVGSHLVQTSNKTGVTEKNLKFVDKLLTDETNETSSTE